MKRQIENVTQTLLRALARVSRGAGDAQRAEGVPAMQDHELTLKIRQMIGAELIQVCYGPSDMQLHFHERSAVFQDFELEVVKAPPDGSSDLRSFLGSSLSNAEFTSVTTLDLAFDNGGVIRAQSDEFTSFRVVMNGEEYEVGWHGWTKWLHGVLQSPG